MITNEQLAYMAGIVDGEGHISYAPKPKDLTGKFARPVVSIGTTTIDLVVWIKQRFPEVGYYHRKAKNSKHKDCHMLVWRSKKAVDLITMIRPWLVIKAKQADIVRTCWSTEQEAKVTYHDLGSVVIEARETAYAELRTLNKRGPAVEAIH